MSEQIQKKWEYLQELVEAGEVDSYEYHKTRAELLTHKVAQLEAERDKLTQEVEHLNWHIDGKRHRHYKGSVWLRE